MNLETDRTRGGSWYQARAVTFCCVRLVVQVTPGMSPLDGGGCGVRRVPGRALGCDTSNEISSLMTALVWLGLLRQAVPLQVPRPGHGLRGQGGGQRLNPLCLSSGLSRAALADV